MVFKFKKVYDAYLTYLGYRPKTFWDYFLETAVKGMLSWLPGIVGVATRNIGYRIILHKVGKLTMISKNVDLKCCRHISLNDRVKLRDSVCINAGHNNRNRIQLDYNVSVGRYTSITSIGGKITIGRNSFISSFVDITAKGDIVIGKNVGIGHGCMIEAVSHNYELLDIPMKEQPYAHRGITIEDDCMICVGVTVLDGVRIGKGSVIGAGTVVTRDIPSYSIAVGVPARVIRNRLDNLGDNKTLRNGKKYSIHSK